MAKTIEQLEQNACKYWPQEISEAVAKINPIPMLIQTQDKFLSILKFIYRERFSKPASREIILEVG